MSNFHKMKKGWEGLCASCMMMEQLESAGQKEMEPDRESAFLKL